MRLLGPVLCVLLWTLLAPVAKPATAAPLDDCRFRLGFRTLHNLIPSIAGECVSDERHNPRNGDSLQATMRGLMVWRKADNFTAFTDGDRTWINGPLGLQTRANTQRFCWEGDADAECLSPVSPLCRFGDPLANVHDPRRLRVIERCATATGVVDSVDKEPDGDIFATIRLDPGQGRLVNGENVLNLDSDLVAEIVPADQTGCVPGQPPLEPFGTADFGICTGANVSSPSEGQRVTVIGPHVLDTEHDWLEIHPVWAVVLPSSRATSP